MSTYYFSATSMAQVKTRGQVEAVSIETARREAKRFLEEGNGSWEYDGLVDDTIKVTIDKEIHEVDLQKPLRIKVRRAFRELTGMEFNRTFEEGVKYFYERLCRAKRPWTKELLGDAEHLLHLAATRAGDCSLFNKGGQAYAALKAIKKCLA